MTSDESDLLAEMRKDLDDICEILRGDDKGGLGLVQKVAFMWRTLWLWPLCSISALGGAGLTLFLEHMFNK